MPQVKQGHKFHPHHPMIEGRDVVLAKDYDALAQQLTVAKVQLQTTQIALQDSNGAVVDLRQQLAASQAREAELQRWIETVRNSSLLLNQRDEAQATITRLEATISKALDLDYQRRQEIARLNETAEAMDKVSQGIEDGLRNELAEAVRLLRCAPWSNWTWWARDTRAYLAAHEGKEND